MRWIYMEKNRLSKISNLNLNGNINTIEAYKRFYIEDKIAVKKLNWNKLNNTPKWIKI